ncbi:holo-ACP synthase [Thermodesulfobacteriota bacterium]
MIYGIGIDLVDIKRVAKVIQRWDDRFIKRVFTEDEAAACYQRAFPPSPFALRFAAKEAFSKALGLGMRNGVRWRDIEVFHHPGGKPDLKLYGRSQAICRQNKIVRFHLSLSDEGDYGIAMVVLEKRDETG